MCDGCEARDKIIKDLFVMVDQLQKLIEKGHKREEETYSRIKEFLPKTDS